MALNDIYSLPSNSAGFTYTTSATNWGAGAYTQITAGLPYDTYILGFNYEYSDNPGDDLTVENLIELATGEAGSEVIKIQLPSPVRRDQNSGYYPKVHVTLPEPLLVTKQTRIAFRIYSSGPSEIFNGVKITYKQGAIIATKLYFHAEGNPNTSGTFPTTEQSSTTTTYTWDSNLRFMDTNIGKGQDVIKTFLPGDLAATIDNFVGFFTSYPLSTNQTVGGFGVTMNLSTASYTSNAGGPVFWAKSLNVYVWRPSTNTKVGTIIDSAATSLGGSTPAINFEKTSYITSIATSAVSALSGDVIICEIWGSSNDTGTNDARFYFDGTTENNSNNVTVTNHASYLSIGQELSFSPVPKTRLYFHEENNPLYGSFPSGEQASTFETYSWNNTSFVNNKLRSMNTTIGVNQVANYTAVGGSDTGATERSFINFFTTPALSVGQTIGGNNIILNVASKWDSIDNPSFAVNRLNIYVWRPSTNTKVGVIKDSALLDITPPSGQNLYPTANNTEQVTCLNIIPTSSVSALEGDVIICEIWGRTRDNFDTADCYFYFDGGVVTTGSNNPASNHASFVEFNQNIQFATVPKTRLYFHDAAASIPGTLPSGEQSTLTSSSTWTGATPMKQMNTTIGSSQVTASNGFNSNGIDTTRNQFARFFCTTPIVTPITLSNIMTLNVAARVSADVGLSWGLYYINIYTWRPATNTKPTTIFVGNINTYSPNTFVTSTTEVVKNTYGIPIATNNVLAGDIIVCEIWSRNDSFIDDTSSATGFFYYDGTTVNRTTDAVVSNHASFLEFNTIIPFSSPIGPNDSNFFLLH